MSKVELALIIGLCLAPLVALFFALPKKLKKEKKEAPATTEYKPSTPAVEEKPAEEPKEVKPEIFDNKGVATDDFKNYMEQKKNKISSPVRIEPPNDIFTEEYIPSRFRRNKQNQI